MNRDIFRGIIIGAIVAVSIGWIVVFTASLNVRITGIEKFLNQAVQNQQAQNQQAQNQIPRK